MTNINPIKFGNSYNFNVAKEEKDAVGSESQKESKPQPQQKEIAPSDVLNYMAAQNIDVRPKERVLDVSKYVSSEDAERIASFVHGFEDSIEEGIQALGYEFPKLEEGAKSDIALAMFNKQYL